MNEIQKTIEAALFMSPKPLQLMNLAQICRIAELTELEKELNELISEFNARDSALEIVKGTEGVKMQVKENFDDKVSHLAAAASFSKAVMKTLAYIAYRQPVRQSQVIKFRSTKAYEEIKLLEEKQFISRERAGLTYIIRTTKKFLKYFGKDSLQLKENPKYPAKEEKTGKN